MYELQVARNADINLLIVNRLLEGGQIAAAMVVTRDANIYPSQVYFG